MKRFLSVIICAALAAAIITGCTSEKGSDTPSQSVRSTVPNPSTAPTQPVKATADDAPASPDSANLDDADINYNSLSIKKNINEI